MGRVQKHRIGHGGQDRTFHTVALTTRRDSNRRKSSDAKNTEEDVPLLSLPQAVRDGNVAVVTEHLLLDPSLATQIHQDGFSCLHYAVRYNGVAVLDIMLSKDVNVNVEGAGHCSPLHIACKYKAADAAQRLLTAQADMEARDCSGKTPLHFAVRRGDANLVKMLLQNGCQVSPRDHDNSTPLHEACHHKNADVVQILLDYQADIEAADISQRTPLIIASIHSHVDVVRRILQAADKKQITKTYVNAVDDELQSALYVAVDSEHAEIAALLLENGAIVNTKKLNKWTPLHVTAIHDYSEIASTLIKHGSHVNPVDEEKMTPFHRAAIFGSLRVMAILLEYGANYDAENMLSYTPLLCAAQKGQKGSVEFLLSKGADIKTVDDKNRSCLHLAVESGSHETSLFVINEAKKDGCDLVNSVDDVEQTPLHYAAASGQDHIAILLLENGASPSARDHDEKTPLHLAAENGQCACIEILLKNHLSEINNGDIEGNSPLLLACENGHNNSAALLLAHGACLTSKNENQTCPLIMAAKNGHVSTVVELLEYRPLINATDKQKNTALHHACYHGHSAVIQLLLDHHADVRCTNVNKESPLDRAMNNQMTDAVVTMVKSKSWMEIMSVRDDEGFTPMKNLIKLSPDGAEVVLNNCVQVNDNGTEVSFNFEYLDPSPDDQCCMKKKYLALTTMVQNKREELLSHTLTQMVLKTKWQQFGRKAYGLNFTNFALFSILLNVVMFKIVAVRSVGQPTSVSSFNDSDGYHPDLLNDLGIADNLFTVLVVLITISVISKLFGMIVHGFDSIFNLHNWLYFVLLGFTAKLASEELTRSFPWRCGWMTVLLSWVNMIMCMRRLDFIGIYIIMFTTVFKTLLKAAVLWVVIVMAFASSFFIVLYDVGMMFQSVSNSVITTFSLSIGEGQFVKIFGSFDESNELRVDAFILGITFIFIMPVALMNLLIGIAVGDIEQVSQHAYLTRAKMQVEFLYNTERSMPKRFQRIFYQKNKVIHIGQTHDSSHDSFWKKSLRSVLGTTNLDESVKQFLEHHEENKYVENLESLKQREMKQSKRLESMQAALELQAQQLKEIHGTFLPRRPTTTTNPSIAISTVLP